MKKEELAKEKLFDEDANIEGVNKDTLAREKKIETLKDLFADWKGDYKCEEWNTGAPVGKEKI